MNRQPGPAAASLEAAVEHHRAGRLVEAEQMYRRILERRPEDAEALHNLGMVHGQRGRMSEALPLLRRAVVLRPDEPVWHCNLGLALEALGVGEASGCFRRALELDPGHAPAHLGLGNRLRRSGDLGGAEHSYRRALSAQPGLLQARVNLGLVFQESDRLDEAVGCYREVLEQTTELPEAGINLGRALLELGRWDESAECFRQTLERYPDSAAAHRGAGRLALARGEPEEALAFFSRALELDPASAEGHNSLGCAWFELCRLKDAEASLRRALELRADFAGAHYNLALAVLLQDREEDTVELCDELLAEHPRHAGALYLRALACPLTFDDSRRSTLESLLSERDASNEHPGLPGFALGHLHHARGASAEAWTMFSRANHQRRQMLEYRIDDDEHRLGRIAEVSTHPWITGGGGMASELPIFLLGMPRSGKTLLERLLADHPEVTAGRELPVIFRILRHLTALPGLEDGYPENVPRLGSEQVRYAAESYLESMDRLWPAARRVTNTVPAHYEVLGLLYRMFPRATFIHCARHPLDTCLASYFKSFSQGQLYSYSLEELGRYFLAYQRLMDHWRSILPAERLLEVRYESLVREPAVTLSRVQAVLGLDAALVEETRPSVDLDPREIGAWRRYREWLAPLIGQLEEAIQAYEAG